MTPLQSIIKRKAEVRRQRKEIAIAAQREQRPPEESPKQAKATAKAEVRKTSASGKAAKAEPAATGVAEAAHHAGATGHSAVESPQGASKMTVAFGRTTKLPPSQPQRQSKSAPLHKVRAGSAENLNVSVN